MPGSAPPQPSPLAPLTPQRYVSAPLAGLSFTQPKATPLAVATPLSSDPLSTKSVYLPRFFTGEILSKTGRVPANYQEYSAAAFTIMRYLQAEQPAFNIVDYISYLEYISGMAENHTWASLMSFDETFRAGVEMGLYTWKTTETPLERTKLVQKLPDSYSYRTESGATVRKARTKSDNSRNKWNEDGKCPHAKRPEGCRYKHVCAKCKSPEHHMAKGHPNETLIVFSSSPDAGAGAQATSN